MDAFARAANALKSNLKFGTGGLRPLTKAPVVIEDSLASLGADVTSADSSRDSDLGVVWDVALIASIVRIAGTSTGAVRVRGAVVDGCTGAAVLDSRGRIAVASGALTEARETLLVFPVSWHRLHGSNAMVGDPILLLECVSSTGATLSWAYVRLYERRGQRALMRERTYLRLGWPPGLLTCDEVTRRFSLESALQLRTYALLPQRPSWDERRSSLNGGALSSPMVIAFRRRRRVEAPPAYALTAILLGVDVPAARLRWTAPNGEVTLALPAAARRGSNIVTHSSGAAVDAAALGALVAPPIDAATAPRLLALPCDTVVAEEPQRTMPMRDRGDMDNLDDAAGIDEDDASAASSIVEASPLVRQSPYWHSPLDPCRPPNRIVATCRSGDRGTTALSFSPDGCHLAIACDGAGVEPSYIRIFDVVGARGVPILVATLAGSDAPVQRLDWNCYSTRYVALLV